MLVSNSHANWLGILQACFSVLIVFFYPYNIVAYNSWLDHVLGWWKQRHNPNVLFLKYEDMKKVLPVYVDPLISISNRRRYTIYFILTYCALCYPVLPYLHPLPGVITVISRCGDNFKQRRKLFPCITPGNSQGRRQP